MKVTEQLRTLAINFNGKYEYRQISVELDKLEKIELERELAVEDYDGLVDALMLVQPSTVREIDILNQIFDEIGWVESETDEEAPATEPASEPAHAEEPTPTPTVAPEEPAEEEPAVAPAEAPEESVETEEAPAEEAEDPAESTEAPAPKKPKGKK